MKKKEKERKRRKKRLRGYEFVLTRGLEGEGLSGFELWPLIGHLEREGKRKEKKMEGIM